MPDFTPSTLSTHQMPPEQLVDVPVPQVRERSSGSLAYELETRRLERLHRRWEDEEAARLVLLEEEQMLEEEEEEAGVEVSRFLPHFRPRRWCWFVLGRQHLPSWLHLCTPCVGASSGLMVVHGRWWLGGLGSGAWHPLDLSWVPLPVLWGRLNLLEARGQGLGIP